MTASDQKTSPDFFKDHDLDPLAAATGSKGPRPSVPVEIALRFALDDLDREEKSRISAALK
ncbi:MAG: hypothetical protein P8X96_08590 [Desulfobacteraceae bacterium]